MIKSYQKVYDWILANMWRDGLSTTAEVIRAHTGVSISTVYAAIKYIDDNHLLRVEKDSGTYLFLNDISQCEFIQTPTMRYYILNVRVIADNITLLTKGRIQQPRIEFSPEGV